MHLKSLFEPELPLCFALSYASIITNREHNNTHSGIASPSLPSNITSYHGAQIPATISFGTLPGCERVCICCIVFASRHGSMLPCTFAPACETPLKEIRS